MRPTPAPAPRHLESLRREVEIDYTHHESVGSGLAVAHVRLRFMPGSACRGVRFLSEVAHGSTAPDVIAGVEHGVYAVSQLGLFAGGEVVGVTATLLEADRRDTSAGFISFAIATALAFRRAGLNGEAVAVEPVMHVEVTVPSAVASTVVAHITAGRRGGVLSVEEREDLGWSLIEAFAPHAELLGFFQTLRQLTDGRCDARMTLAGYWPTLKQPSPSPGGPDVFPPAVGLRA